MRSKIAERIHQRVSADTRIYVRLYSDLVVRIGSIMEAKGITRVSLAEKLEKSPSEITKWLNGDHNFTLKSLAKLEAELGESLIEVPVTKPLSVEMGDYIKEIHQTAIYTPKSKKVETGCDWEVVNTKPGEADAA